MSDIHQSALYISFMLKMGWIVEKIDGVYIFIKKFRFLGATSKIQRANNLPSKEKLKLLLKRHNVKSVSFEPGLDYSSSKEQNDESRSSQSSTLNNNFQLLKSPFLPTKTIHIDLKPPEDVIFKKFSEAKQRGVRRAQKKGVCIAESKNISEFIQLKNKTAGFMGFLTTTTLPSLWSIFGPKNAAVLIAYKNSESNLLFERGEAESRTNFKQTSRLRSKNNIIAGILLLFHQKTAYYWIAAATQEGKKSFAPTLLVWEALKRSKKKGCTIFDFEGIYDERYPNLNKNWSGFTKFKEGFGGEIIYFPKPFIIK